MPAPAPAASPALVVSASALLPWSDLAPARVVDVGPPTGSALELPGPRTRPVRPHLELFASPSGLAARVVQGDGAAVALAVLGDAAPATIAIADGALAVSAWTDGVWVLYRDRLEARGKDGAVRHKLERAGVTLVGGAAGAVWVVGADAAWHVDAAGVSSGPFPWRSPLTSFARGGDLCVRDAKSASALSCQPAAGGAATSVTLPFDLEPLEHPVAFGKDLVFTAQGQTLRARRGADLIGAWTFQAAGLGAGLGAGPGAAKPGFAITAASGSRTIWRQAAAPLVAAGAPAALSAAALDDAGALLYGQGQAATYRAGAAAPAAPSGAPDVAAPEVATIDEAAYRDALFPKLWALSPLRALAVTGDTIVLAASGPDGVAMVRATVAP